MLKIIIDTLLAIMLMASGYIIPKQQEEIEYLKQYKRLYENIKKRGTK